MNNSQSDLNLPTVRRYQSLDALLFLPGVLPCGHAPASGRLFRRKLARDVPHPNAVRLALDHRRELRNEAPPVAVILPEHVKARDAHVQPHSLEPYDQLKEQADE